MTGIKFQIGKLGVNEGIINSLLMAFKNHKVIRISALKSSGRDRNSIELLAQELAKKLTQKSKNSYVCKIIGFTIIMKKRSKP